MMFYSWEPFRGPSTTQAKYLVAISTLYVVRESCAKSRGAEILIFYTVRYSGLLETCPFVFPFGFPVPRFLRKVFSQLSTSETIILKRRGLAFTALNTVSRSYFCGGGLRRGRVMLFVSGRKKRVRFYTIAWSHKLRRIDLLQGATLEVKKFQSGKSALSHSNK